MIKDYETNLQINSLLQDMSYGVTQERFPTHEGLVSGV